jgi:CheY-like chemotaxis protein
MRLLVVDDNAVNRRLVKIHFEDWAIDEAENGQQGVWMAQSAVVPYHAILMDINMPVMDGYDATRAIRRLAPYKRTPILGISANAMSTDERWMECGMTAMHPKPVKWGTLREAILETVRQVSVTTDGSDSLMVPRTCADRKREPDSPRFSVAGHPHAPQFSDVISGAASGAGAASGHRSGCRTTSSSASSTALPSCFSVLPSTSPSIMSGSRVNGRLQSPSSTLFTSLHSP